MAFAKWSCLHYATTWHLDVTCHEMGSCVKKPNIFSTTKSIFKSCIRQLQLSSSHFTFFEMSGIQSDLVSNHIQIEWSKGQRGLLLTWQCHTHLPPPIFTQKSSKLTQEMSVIITPSKTVWRQRYDRSSQGDAESYLTLKVTQLQQMSQRSQFVAFTETFVFW